jgi:hypothetical protein
MYTSGVRFVTGRVNARADLSAVIDLVTAGLDPKPVVEVTADWEDAPEVWTALRGKTVITRT